MSKNKTPLFCQACGTPLDTRMLENRARNICPSCGWIDYTQLKVGAGAVLEQDGRILLLRRATYPWQGNWNLPAGYVEFDEDPARAAERETLEETGLQVRAKYLLDALYFDDDPRGYGILLVYACDIVDGVLRNSFESSELQFFAPNAIPDNLCGAGHARAIRAWQIKNQF